MNPLELFRNACSKIGSVNVVRSAWMALLMAMGIQATAVEQVPFDTSWMPTKPEVRTYRSVSRQWGNGYYQVSVWKSEAGIETTLSILTSAYMKFLQGKFGLDLSPIQSKGVIVIGGHVVMESEETYVGGKVHVSTLVKPYNRTTSHHLASTARVIDPSMIPLMGRLLPLAPGKEFSFPALDPVTNSLGTYTLKVVGEESMQNVLCFKAETSSFEGKATIWVEKAMPHRILRIETAQQNGVHELIL